MKAKSNKFNISGDSKEAILEKMVNYISVPTTMNVIPQGGNWILKTQGSVRAQKAFSSKESAIQFARKETNIKNSAKQIIVHRKDGSIEEIIPK